MPGLLGGGVWLSSEAVRFYTGVIDGEFRIVINETDILNKRTWIRRGECDDITNEGRLYLETPEKLCSGACPRDYPASRCLTKYRK